MEDKNRVFELKKSSIVFLFVYYILILLTGIFLSIWVVCNIDSFDSKKILITETFIASFSVCGMLSSIQYIHKLYKICITKRVVPPSSNISGLGNFAYFFTRPIFAFAFVVVLVIALLSGLFIVSGELDYIINDKFLYLCVILSSFVGFSIGKVLDMFKVLSDSQIKKLGATKNDK